MTEELVQKAKSRINEYRADWCLFAKEVLGVMLDQEQEDILRSVQVNPMTSVASGTARGKDFISAVACLCFMYLTPTWNAKGELIGNTKVAMTAPTDRQVGNIMVPEVTRLWHRAKSRGVDLPGRLTGYDIRTDNKEWFLTGFKADEHQTEAWTGFHAVNTMFVVTEASGMADATFHAIEGNLQGNSRLLIVFNPNVLTGYAAKSQKSPRFAKFRLNSLNAYNVKAKKDIIPGQVDYKWVKDKLEEWCTPIQQNEFKEEEDDFTFEGQLYRPNDLFRVKVLGKSPKVSDDVLIPLQWVEKAQENWRNYFKGKNPDTATFTEPLRLGADVAGMGRDNSELIPRYGNVVPKIISHNSAGVADHMYVVGLVSNELKRNPKGIAMIDTIGEGAGVYSRLVELKFNSVSERVFSYKGSYAAEDQKEQPAKDLTGEYEFANMRAYSYWALRDWLNPKNGFNPCLPPDAALAEELAEHKWKFQSSGKVIIEPKDDIQKRLKRSPDKSDALAQTFMPVQIKTPGRTLANYI